MSRALFSNPGTNIDLVPDRDVSFVCPICSFQVHHHSFTVGCSTSESGVNGLRPGFCMVLVWSSWQHKVLHTLDETSLPHSHSFIHNWQWGPSRVSPAHQRHFLFTHTLIHWWQNIRNTFRFSIFPKDTSGPETEPPTLSSLDDCCTTWATARTERNCQVTFSWTFIQTI